MVGLLVAPSQTTRHWKKQFGRMLIEAFDCGVPVIGSDSGEIPHVIGDAGRVVGEKDVAGWADAIDETLERPDLRGELAEWATLVAWSSPRQSWPRSTASTIAGPMINQNIETR